MALPKYVWFFFQRIQCLLIKNGILRVFDAFNHTLHWAQIAFEVALEKSYTPTFSQDIMPNFTVAIS